MAIITIALTDGQAKDPRTARRHVDLSGHQIDLTPCRHPPLPILQPPRDRCRPHVTTPDDAVAEPIVVVLVWALPWIRTCDAVFASTFT